mmetsp:Transcript_8904/g.20195  ORF Transcript_8904/g.20195 Transcript_8904/m.20195 type:complete len:268 (+) Transcript_8904:780-1583(+)
MAASRHVIMSSMPSVVDASWPSESADAPANPDAASSVRLASPSALTCLTDLRRRKRSYSASSSSDSGNSLDAPTRHSSGTLCLSVPLSNSLSLSRVSSALRMAEFALKISSTNATSAVGRYPSVCRTYLSFSSPDMERGPNSSSGTENRVSSLSKNRPWHTSLSLRASSLLAVPGGPSRRRCSPASAASSMSLTSVSLSRSPCASRSAVALTRMARSWFLLRCSLAVAALLSTTAASCLMSFSSVVTSALSVLMASFCEAIDDVLEF